MNTLLTHKKILLLTLMCVMFFFQPMFVDAFTSYTKPNNCENHDKVPGGVYSVDKYECFSCDEGFIQRGNNCVKVVPFERPTPTTLSGISQFGVGSNADIVNYLNWLYLMTISLGSIFAVIKIALAGVKYMLSDVVTSKSDAKNDIVGALLGLAIILSSFIVLNTIYPKLTNLNILQGLGGGSVQPETEEQETDLETNQEPTGGVTCNGAFSDEQCSP